MDRHTCTPQSKTFSCCSSMVTSTQWASIKVITFIMTLCDVQICCTFALAKVNPQQYSRISSHWRSSVSTVYYHTVMQHDLFAKILAWTISKFYLSTILLMFSIFYIVLSSMHFSCLPNLSISYSTSWNSVLQKQDRLANRH